MPAKNRQHDGGTPRISGETSVTILGSGTCVPSLERSSSAALATLNRENFLIDIGPGTTGRLLMAGVTIFDISHLFITHFHPDHTGELASFLFSYKYAKRSIPKKEVTLIGGWGLSEFYAALKTAYGRWISQDDDWQINVVEMDVSGLGMKHFGGFTLHTIPVDHNPESLACKIEDADGKTVVYSGDTDYCRGLTTLAEDADLLICEASNLNEKKAPGHMTPALAGKTARLARAKKLVLTHFYPECTRADIYGQCRAEYAGPLMLAEDLMKIDI